MTDSDRDLAAAIEYAETRLSEAENVIWNVESEQLSEAQKQSLNDLSEELWTIQNRLTEIKEDCAE